MPCGTEFLRRMAALLCLAIPAMSGCAAFHPMNGVPARYIPDELKVARRNGQRMIDLSLLNQRWDGVHRVDTGDVLGIYIGGVLGKIDENPQVAFPQNSDYLPAAGVPVTVREDGTISLPMIGSLTVRGLTTRETEDAIRNAYTNHAGDKEFLKPGRERILVSLQRPRQIRILVVRQDSRMEPVSNAMVGMVNLGGTKRGSAKAVNLPAYRNDVLNALIATDGLPGLDAENAVYIIRRNPNINGGDHAIPPPFDPEQLIREMKQNQKPVFRGQNSDGFAYRSQFNQGASNTNSGMYSDYRQSPTANSNSLFNQNPANYSFQDGSSQAPAWNQQQPNGWQDSAQTQFNNSAPGGFSDSTTVDQVQYQNPQSVGVNNGVANPWNYGNPANTSSPTPLTPIPQQPNLGRSSGIPQQNFVPAVPPASANPYAQQPNYGQQPWNAAPPVGSPTPMGQNLPPQGYANPDNVFQNGPATPLDGPTGQFGGYGDQMVPNEPPDPGTTTIGIADGRRIIRIPIRLRPDETIDIKNEDVILNDGDIVFIESRDAEVFFTGGLLGGGQYTLPREYDLDILQALSIATSRINSSGAVRAIGGVSALNSDVTISPSNVVVIRKLPEGGEIPIKINLYEARNDLSERIFIQPGDYIFLQYTPLEAVAAFIDRHLIEGALFGLIAQQATTNNRSN